MNKKVITIAGGGSTYTPGVVKAILLKKDVFPVEEIRMYDIDAQRQLDVSVIVDQVIKVHAPEVKLIVTTEPEIAFKDADFVFAQIRVGKYEMREKDEKIPLKYGVVGQETCGPGGLAYGMRTIMPMVEIIDLTEKYAKQSCWILNYSNPAAIVADAMKKLRPNARIINICDMPVAIIDAFAIILDTTPEKLTVNYFGLNHFGWFTDVFYKGENKIKELLKHVQENGYLTNIPDEQHYDPSWRDTYYNAKYLTEFFPEYLPNTYLQYYLLNEQMVAHSDPNYTRANEVQNGREKNLFNAINQYKDTQVFDESAFTVGVHGSFIIDLAASLSSNEPGRYLLIVENQGAIENLPDDAMVEIPCYVSERGIEKTSIGKIPQFYKGLIEQQLSSEKLIVEAAIEGSYKKALMSFATNKTVPSSEKAKLILDEMIIANKDYWPELK